MARKLLLETRVSAPDGAGGQTEMWAPVTEFWAEIRGRSAREEVVAGRQRSRISHQATIRYLPFGHDKRPVPRQRFREGGRIYAILGVSEADARRERLIVWLEEGVAS